MTDVGTCVHGTPLLGTCEACARFVAAGVRQFEADVKAGKHDAQGYTRAERSAKDRRRQRALFLEATD